MANETIAQAHRNLARLFSASTSAAVAAVAVFAGFVLPMRLAHMADKFSALQLWGQGIILEIVVICALAVMIRDIRDAMRH